MACFISIDGISDGKVARIWNLSMVPITSLRRGRLSRELNPASVLPVLFLDQFVIAYLLRHFASVSFIGLWLSPAPLLSRVPTSTPTVFPCYCSSQFYTLVSVKIL